MGRTSGMVMGFAGLVCVAAGQPGGGSPQCWDMVCETFVANPQCTSGLECDDQSCWGVAGTTFTAHFEALLWTECSVCEVAMIVGECVPLTCGPREPVQVRFDLFSGECGGGGGGEQ